MDVLEVMTTTPATRDLVDEAIPDSVPYPILDYAATPRTEEP